MYLIKNIVLLIICGKKWLEREGENFLEREIRGKENGK